MANIGQTNHKDSQILPLAQSIGAYSDYVSVVSKNIRYIKKYRYDISKFSDAKKVKLVDLLIKKYKLVKLRDFIGGSLSHNDIEISQRALSPKAKKDIEKRFKTLERRLDLLEKKVFGEDKLLGEGIAFSPVDEDELPF